MFEPTISEPMTWAQICERYPAEWVALVEIDWVNDRDFDFRSARVIGHGSRREQDDPVEVRPRIMNITNKLARTPDLPDFPRLLSFPNTERYHKRRFLTLSTTQRPWVLLSIPEGSRPKPLAWEAGKVRHVRQ